MQSGRTIRHAVLLVPALIAKSFPSCPAPVVDLPRASKGSCASFEQSHTPIAFYLQLRMSTRLAASTGFGWRFEVVMRRFAGGPLVDTSRPRSTARRPDSNKGNRRLRYMITSGKRKPAAVVLQLDSGVAQTRREDAAWYLKGLSRKRPSPENHLEIALHGQA